MIKSKFALLPVLLVLTSVLLTANGWAQDQAASADKTFVEVFLDGGIVMWFLLFQSILVITFTIEGFLKFRLAKLAPQPVMALVRDALASGNYAQAIGVCQANPCFFSRVLAAGLQRIGKGKDAVMDSIADVATGQATALKSNLNYLSVIGVTAPMFGLLGTVTGMIKAFQTLGSTGVADMGSLSAAISEVLVTTAGGLVVAIPAFILYYVLRNIAGNSIIRADSEVALMLEDIPYDQLVGYQFDEYQE